MLHFIEMRIARIEGERAILQRQIDTLERLNATRAVVVAAAERLLQTYA